MAATSLSDSVSSFAVCYGFMEGSVHGSSLKKLLTKAGYRQTNILKADIIVAHSAGCWLMPAKANPKLVVYIGMPLAMARPPKTWVRANITSLLHGPLTKNLTIRLKNTYAGLAHPIRNFKIMRHPKIAQPVTFPKASAVFIANRYDPWPQGPELEKLISEEPWAFISLQGAHEHIWECPEQYVSIIGMYAKRLLA